MTSIEEHQKKIQEHLEELYAAMEIGADKRAATIAFHCSAGALQLLELYLHVTSKIEMGRTLNHEWFKRPTSGQKKEPLIDRHLPVDFPQKSEIYEHLYRIEERRNSLMYGKPMQQQVEEVITAFNKLKETFKRLLHNEGIEIQEA